MRNTQTFLRFVIPSILSFALSGVYSIVDGFFVGNAIGDAGLSAVNIAYPLVALLQAVGTGIGMGGAVRYQIHTAEGHAGKARQYIAGGMWLMLVSGLLLTVGLYVTAGPVLTLFGASGELLTLSVEYLQIIALGSMPQIFGTGLLPYMRNYGGSFWAMVAMIAGFVVNIVLDYVYVWVMGDGMFGAALATVIGQVVTMVIALIYCARQHRLTLRIHTDDVPDTCLSILAIGLSPFGLTMAPNIASLIITRFSVTYGGQEAVAVYSCIGYVVCVIYLILQGVGDGSQPLMSYYYGTGERTRLRQTQGLAYGTALLLAVAGMVILYLTRAQVGLLFGTSDATNTGITAVMPIFLVSVPFVAFTRIATSAFYATEQSSLSYIVTFAEPLLMLVLMLILSRFGGQIMIWWSAVAARIITAIIAVVLTRNAHRKSWYWSEGSAGST